MSIRKELEEAVKVDKSDLDEELIRQPELFYQAAKAFAQASGLRDQAKWELEKAEATIDGQLRGDALAAQSKMTDKAVEREMEVHPRIIKLKGAYLDAKNEVERWEALKDAFQMRSYGLKDLAALYIANYYSTESGGRARAEAQDIVADRNRRAAGEKRMAAGPMTGRVKRGE